MTTIQYIQRFGLAGAKYVLANIPDKTATHLGVLIDDEPTYYSLDFCSYWDNCDWQDSNFRTVAELSEAYKDGWCVDLSELKRLVESVDPVKEHYTLDRAKKYADSPYTAPELKNRLEQVIADYEALYPFGGDQ